MSQVKRSVQTKGEVHVSYESINKVLKDYTYTMVFQMAERSISSPFDDCGSRSMSDSFVEEMNRGSISVDLDMSQGERVSPRTLEINRFAEMAQDSGSSDSNQVTSTTSPNHEQIPNISNESLLDEPSYHPERMDSHNTK